MGRTTAACITAMAIALLPATAHAIGGLLPDADTLAQVQTTETAAIMAIDGRTVELHLRLTFETTEVHRVAWVIPVPSVPQFAVGSERLFTNVGGATVPTFRTVRTQTPCAVEGTPPPDDPFDDPGEAPLPIASNMVGGFDATVLGDASQADVMGWLGDNGYAVPSPGGSIVGDYAALGYSFVIVELLSHAGVNVVHPITLRFEDPQPELPVRLARLTAIPDMDIRLIVLGEDRWVPGDYGHVTLNPVAIDWLQLGANYHELVALAVDVEGADGQAVVTESTGTTTELPRDGLFDARWNPDAFGSLNEVQVAGELVRQGVYICHGGPMAEFATCDPQHPLADALLSEFLLSDGVTLGDFYHCPSCFADKVTWKPAGFTEAFRSRIVEPGRHAMALLDALPSYSRMLTRMSASELTADPRLLLRTGDDPIAAARVVHGNERCDGDLVMRFDDGRELLVPDGGPWPDLSETMPVAERVEQMTAAGANLVLVDNGAAIDEAIDDYNREHGWPSVSCAGCRVPTRPAPTALLLGLVALGGWRRRR